MAKKENLTDPAAGLMLSNSYAPVEINENDVTAEIDLATAKKLLGLPDDFVFDENTVFVDVTELNNLVEQNHTLKDEVGKLVGLFQHFTGLFTGSNIMAIAMKIPSLIKDAGIKAQVENVLPIIEKYKPKS